MFYRGLDVSLKQTALCVVDGNGQVVMEAKLITAPEVISRFLTDSNLICERIGLNPRDQLGAEPVRQRPGISPFGYYRRAHSLADPYCVHRRASRHLRRRG